MTIDRSRFRNDVRRLAKGAAASRPPTITAEIRQLMPDIERMRSEDRAPWRAIAQALAEQGVTEGLDKRPISDRRLTSIVTKLRAHAIASAVEGQRRGHRRDVATEGAADDPLPVPERPKTRLAPELSEPPEAVPNEPPLSEDEIRRSQRDKHQHLFKKD
jgi:hypothetical protein